MIDNRKLAEELLDFIHACPSEFHVVEQSEKMLSAKGFKKLDSKKKWEIVKGGKYYTTTNDSAFTAFIVGTGDLESDGFKIVEAHTDSPSIKIKPCPEMVVDNHYLKLNAEVYGSPILNTWLDRPLSLAGRVSLRSDDLFNPSNKLVNFNRPLLTIPNLSIHHNKSVNSGIELNKQKDMLPLLGIIDDTFEKKNYLIKMLAKELNIDSHEILDFELSMSEFERGCLFGADREFISTTKLDNLLTVFTGLKALLEQNAGRVTSVLTCFDNEEVGNRTRQGADSPMLMHTLERVAIGLGKSREDFLRSISASFMISSDLSHAYHPNAPEKSDPVVHVQINKGPVVKVSGTQKFTTDSNTSAVFKMLCDSANVPCQYYINKSDSPGGSSAGPASVSHIGIRSVDIGVPIFAMHSIREMGGVQDNFFMYMAFSQFFSE